MRDFFKNELKTLHLKTSYQQYFKLSEMADGPEQIRVLLDELVKMCNNFPLIPEVKKKEIVLSYMITDADFQGFNPKILWKWFNAENRKYLPASQSQYVEDPDHKPAPPEVADKWLQKWQEELAKIGDPQYMTSGIKDQRIQAMKSQLEGIECSHTSVKGESEYHEFDPGILTCMTCGHKKPKEPSGSPLLDS